MMKFPMINDGVCTRMQLDARSGEVISSDADPAIRFKTIGRDKGNFRTDSNKTVNYDRIIGSTIGFRSAWHLYNMKAASAQCALNSCLVKALHNTASACRTLQTNKVLDKRACTRS